MRRPAALVAVLSLLVLTACSQEPPRDEVTDRFLTELTDSETIRAGMGELAADIVEEMFDGKCGSLAYEAGLSSDGTDPALFYAWRVTCSMYFEGDMSSQQLEETEQMVLERAVNEG